MPGKRSIKKRQDKQEEQLSDVSENVNEYQKDDFVVDSDDDDDQREEQQFNSDNEEYNSLELSEEDLQLIEENKKKNKGRLQRKVDSSDDEPINKDDDEYKLGDDLQLKKHKMKHQHDDDDELPLEEDFDQDYQKVLGELIDPTQRQQGYLQELDEKIINLDIPERVQQLYLSMLGRLPDAQVQRDPPDASLVKWIYDRLLSERTVQIKVSEKSNFMDGVKQILECYRTENLEAYCVYTYKSHLITPIITLDEYWRIQELDIEYEIYSTQRELLRSKMQALESKGYKFSMLIDQLLSQALKSSDLADISEYLTYVDLKLKCKQKAQQLRERSEQNLVDDLGSLSLGQSKSRKREQLLIEAYFFRIDELAPQVSYSADEFAELLAGLQVNLQSRGQGITIDDFTVWSDPNYKQVADKKSVILLLQSYISIEFYTHPFIRHHVGSEYNRYAHITTEPTQLGNKELTALSYLYPIKRIKNRPVKYMEDDSYLMLMQGEELQFVKSTIKVQEHQKQEKKQYKDDEVITTLISKFKQFTGDRDKDKEERIENLRDFVLRKFLERLYPLLERRLRDHLKEQGIMSVVRQCGREFRQLINQAPHECSVDADGATVGEEDQQNKRIMSLVLAYDDGTIREHDLAKTFTKDYTLQKKHTAMVIVDRKGEVLNQSVFNYLTLNKQSRPDLAEQRKKEVEIFEAIFQQYQPDLVVISANQPECLRIRADLREQYQNQKITQWVSVADTTVSHIYSLTEKSSIQLPETPQILREAISLARMKLNPLAEVLNVWDDNPKDNACLHIQLHPLQKCVPNHRLHAELLKVACEVVNSVGVEIVDAALHSHLQGQVQFLCGVGPRKAKKFMQYFKSLLSQNFLQTHFESEKRIIAQMSQESDRPIQIERLDLLKTQIFQRNVFKNIQGFVKLSKGKNPFDRTRLTTQMYGDAYYIARSALDIESGKDDRDYSIVQKLMKNPQKLDDLELEEWAVQKEQKDKIRNYIKVVNFMKNELTSPFKHTFEKSVEMSNREIFYKVTQESPHTFKKYTIVTGPILWIKEDILCIRISDAGLTGMLHKREFESPHSQLREDFHEGQVLKAFVKNIEALEDKRDRNKDSKNVNIFRVELTLKPEWNIRDLIVVMKQDYWMKPYPFKEYDEKVKSTFDLKEGKNHDCPTIQLGTQVNKTQKLVIRKINHPKFKQVMLKGAIDYIESQRVGEYIIRPSSRGKDYLTITWKFFEGVIVHLQIKEEHRQDNYKPKLILGKDEFESFDEIYERYIVPCNNHMEAAANNTKFSHESVEQMEKRLREEKEKDTSIVPYGFCVSERAPQFLVLLYVPKDRVEKEYIKVKPEGLSFHGLVQSTLKDLITWFKQNFRSTEYKSYMRKTKAPFPDSDKVQQFNQSWGQMDTKKERGKDEKVKYEGSDYSSILCSKCNKRGHAANDCRGDRDRGDRSERSGDRGDRSERSGYKGKYENKYESNKYDSSRGRSDQQKRGPPTCFNCNEVGHMKKNCPSLSNNPQSRLTSNYEQSYNNNEGPSWNTGSGYHKDRSRSRERKD